MVSTRPSQVTYSALQVKLRCQKSSWCLGLHRRERSFLESFWFCEFIYFLY